MTDDLKARALRAIEESEARWSKATPGPWRTSVYQGGHDDSSVLGIDGVIVEYADQANAEAIAHAPTEAATLCGLLTEALASRDNCHASHDLDAETIAGLAEDVERLTADNAALIEALTGCGELCHADGCEGSHDWDTDDSDDCTCGATPINLARRAALAPIRNRKEPTND